MYRPAKMLDLADRSSIAHHSAWEASKVDRLTRGGVATLTKRRIIDAIRSRHGEARREAQRKAELPLRPEMLGPDNPGGCDVELKETILRLAGGDRRTVDILTRLAFGERKAEVAAALGVSPGRISQLLRDVRSRGVGLAHSPE